jgi:hypothetical protein
LIHYAYEVALVEILGELQQRVEARVLESARTAQAGVIASLAGVTGAGPGEVKPFGWLAGAQLEMLALVFADPARAIDRQYRFVARLLDLHREFAQRLFDVVEQLDGPGPEVHRDLARVVRLDSRRASTGS